MSLSTLSLLASRRLAPLLCGQLLLTLVDTLLRNAVTILITYRLAVGGSGMLLLAATILFVLPGILLSGLTGRVADRFPKTRAYAVLKVVETGVALMGAGALLLDSVPVLLATLFLLGAVVAFNAPLRYGMMPEQLKSGEIAAGNALIGLGCLLILPLGILLGGTFVLAADGPEHLGYLIILAAILGVGAALFLPSSRSAAPDLPLEFRPFGDLRANLALVRGRRELLVFVAAITWIRFAILITGALYPAYARDRIGLDPAALTLVLVLGGVGFGLGSAFCMTVARGPLTYRHAPVMIGTFILLLFDLWFADVAPPLAKHAGSVIPHDPAAMRVMIDYILLSALNGGLMGLLYTELQQRAAAATRVRVIAATNATSSFAVMLGAVVTAGLAASGLDTGLLFLLLAASGLALVAYTVTLAPDKALKASAALILELLYRTRMNGFESLKAIEGAAIIVVDRMSLIGGVLLAAFLPGRPLFVIDAALARARWTRVVAHFADLLPVDTTAPLAFRTIARAAAQTRVCVLFVGDHLADAQTRQRIADGLALAIAHSGAPIVPVRLAAAPIVLTRRPRAWFRILSRVAITVLPAQRFASATGRRAAAPDVARLLQTLAAPARSG